VDLVGRDALLREMAAHLTLGRSVLLFGPEGVGKTAVIQAGAVPGLTIVDPFEHVSTVAAFRIRRAMDRGAVFLAAARTTDRRVLGHVGRVLWRMRTMRVMPLTAAEIRLVIERQLARAQIETGTLPPGWLNAAAAEAAGLPGQAILLVGAAARRWRATGAWPPPGFALAVARDEAWRGPSQPFRGR